MNYQKNIKIINGLEKALKEIGGEGSFSCEIKGKDGKLTEVSKEEFARWMVNEKNKDSWVGGVFSLKPKNSEIERQKNKLLEEDTKDDKKQIDKLDESSNRHFIDNGDSLIHSVEKKDKDEVIKESYIKSNWKSPEQEITDKETKQEKTDENFSNSDKKDHQSKEEVNQQNQSQKIENKDNNSKSIYYGIGLVCLTLVMISAMIVWVKKKK